MDCCRMHISTNDTTTSTTRSSSIKLSKLQMKGVFALTLFLITADSAFARPARKIAAAKTTAAKTKPTEAECSVGSSYDATCSTAPPPEGFLPKQYRNNRLPNTHLNCESKACTNCLQLCNNGGATAAAATAAASIPRGGHMAHSHSAADAAAVAVPPPYGIPLNVWKVLLQAFLTCLNVVCWYVPLKSKRMAQNELLLSMANAFSGGVFLSLAFLHLIPECAHAFPSNWPEAAPFGLVLLGYLIIFFVEKIAFDAHDILHEMQAGPGGGGVVGNTHSHSHTHHHHAASESKTMNGTAKATTISPPDAASTSSVSSVAAPAEAPVASASTGRSAMILLAALGVHSVLEMMALGLSDTFSDAALLTGSIALHQPAESIALLVAFVKSGLTESEIISYLSIFSCMGPVGVALGMAVNEYAAPVVDSIMLAIVAGTFVYVGATEVIPEEWETSEHKWKKFGALMTGIGMIVAITQYTASLGH